jgi:A/G-specific adenine glycosylase
MIEAASATVAFGETVTSSLLMTSRIVCMASRNTSPARGPGEVGRTPTLSADATAAIRERVLAWYGPRPHDYPWRRRVPDPYGVLVSEVMLQQTQASRVAVAYPHFIRRFPDVVALSSAGRAELLRAWGGLGYPRRALALRQAARAVVRDHDGRVPDDVAHLRALAGVGPYTAAAVASIAFGVAVAAVDTNVRRITARVLFGAEPEDIAARALQAGADALVDPASPGAWNQAMMDLGRFVCRPAPRCGGCPLREVCRSALDGAAPRRTGRRQPAFEGSARQARGRVLAELRARGAASVGELADATGMPVERTSRAAAALASDGLVSMCGGEGSPDAHVRID